MQFRKVPQMWMPFAIWNWFVWWSMHLCQGCRGMHKTPFRILLFFFKTRTCHWQTNSNCPKSNLFATNAYLKRPMQNVPCKPLTLTRKSEIQTLHKNNAFYSANLPHEQQHRNKSYQIGISKSKTPTCNIKCWSMAPNHWRATLRTRENTKRAHFSHHNGMIEIHRKWQTFLDTLHVNTRGVNKHHDPQHKWISDNPRIPTTLREELSLTWRMQRKYTKTKHNEFDQCEQNLENTNCWAFRLSNLPWTNTTKRP